jgi:hypothetical protein
MGLFKTSIICEKGKSNLVHSVKMLNKKYASELTSKQIEDLNPDFKKLEIVETGNSKMIAGYDCKEVKVKVLSDSSWMFNLYFTDKISIKNSNQHTPFKSIKGVLMEYEIISYDTHMRFSAVEVNKTEVDLESIALTNDYQMISPERLKSEIEGIFAKVK